MYLVMAMVAVAVVATGIHVMTLTSPALAEQDRQSRAREAAAEHSIVAHAPAAATDGLPVPILVGGIVLAFAVGLTGGHLHRRRRLARRSLVLSSLEPVAPRTRTRTVQPPPAPAPEPPAAAVIAPQPVELAPPRPEPVPEPPAPQAPAPRVIEPPAAPVPPPPAPPSEPARPVQPAEPLRLVQRAPAPKTKPKTKRAPAPKTKRAPVPPLAQGPEVPVQPEAALPDPGPVPPLGDAPEALLLPPSAEAPEPQAPAATPGRRFARATEWPQEASQLWTCELDWKAGYRRAAFRAMAGAPGADKRQPLGESAPVRWALNAEPEPPTPALAMRVRGLVEALEAAGWEHIGRGHHWYAQRFLWRGSGAPQPVTVTGVEPAER